MSEEGLRDRVGFDIAHPMAFRLGASVGSCCAADPVICFWLFRQNYGRICCALQIAEQDQQLIAITGEPITPGRFAG
jgi:hypothetical protein